MKKYIKGILKFLLQILLSTAVILCIDIGISGMYLIGIPQIENVEKVTISYPAVTDEVKELSDGEQIGLAVKLSGFLKYAPFRQPGLNEEPWITITYYTADGKTIPVCANRTTVWWKGKAHVLKDDETFINLTEGIFFLEDLAE